MSHLITYFESHGRFVGVVREHGNGQRVVCPYVVAITLPVESRDKCFEMADSLSEQIRGSQAQEGQRLRTPPPSKGDGRIYMTREAFARIDPHFRSSLDCSRPWTRKLPSGTVDPAGYLVVLI